LYTNICARTEVNFQDRSVWYNDKITSIQKFRSYFTYSTHSFLAKLNSYSRQASIRVKYYLISKLHNFFQFGCSLYNSKPKNYEPLTRWASLLESPKTTRMSYCDTGLQTFIKKKPYLSSLC